MSLNGTVISNGSYIYAGSIGEGDNALFCHTDNHSCCRTPLRAGQWYFPNGSAVEILGNRYYYGYINYFYRNRGEGIVRLNRIGTPSESGYFYCQIPDVSGTIQTVHLNIGWTGELVSCYA